MYVYDYHMICTLRELCSANYITLPGALPCDSIHTTRVIRRHPIR